jgi:hypothetical protein
MREVPGFQRHLHRPALDKLLGEKVLRAKRNSQIADAVEKHGYAQQGVADHLDMNYSTLVNFSRYQS